SKYLGLERVIFIPANIPPHKGALKIVSGESRLRMLELAIQDNPLFEVSTVELERSGPSYTIDTINELREKFGIDPTLMVGSDSLKELSTWRSMDDILRLADLAVVERVGFELKGKLPVELATEFCYDKNSGLFVNTYGRKIALVPGTLSEISSTMIREAIRIGDPVTGLTPESVIDFIRQNNLYT
ncbi:MAG: nicotinate (nicotinamide) nucleotide adenylyltransferase, partial [Deltaproteobacteria bacterium]|nr:nicotinate (nicotinamide) nucleotide adenylyltransferase [Deltaproteobacteria bacterium]